MSNRKRQGKELTLSCRQVLDLDKIYVDNVHAALQRMFGEVDARQ